MRKYSGLLVALILLALPAFANAGQLTVKVVGGSATNYVALTGGATKASITAGTNYYYPTTTTTITLNGAYASPSTVVVTPSGSPANLTGGSGVYTFSGTGNASITVTYSTAVTTGYVTITQPTGKGTIFVQLPNGTFTSANSTIALPKNTPLPVTISPNSNYAVTSVINITDLTTTLPVTPTTVDAGRPVTGTVTIPSGGGEIIISAGLVPVTMNTVSLKAVGSAYATETMVVSATATSNFPDTPVSIAFAVTGCDSTLTSATPLTPSTYGAPVSFSFKPSTAGQTCTVKATVGSATSQADVPIGSATAAKNNICFGCHNSSTPAIVAAFNSTGGHMNSNLLAADKNVCVTCHTDAPHDVGKTCIGCHSVGQKNAGAGFVNDNNGVRSITQEFSKWSHHVTGVTLNDAHCVACHLEGKVSADGKSIDVDKSTHMINNTTHLRNADTDDDMAWDPAAPNHTTMDNFCMSCHDANGATSPMSANIQKFINDNLMAAAGKTASATNPFGDTISNQYDKMQRPAVVNVDSQFNTTNNSHHGVKGQRYSKRTRIANASDPRAMTAAQSSTFASNSSANLPGKRTTIFDAGKFNAFYAPLGTAVPPTAATSLGDDSTLHCGDCHTVGQWKPGVAANAAGVVNTVAIGAHGSANEYMLRNSIGTDARHQGIQMDQELVAGKSAYVFHNDNVTPYLVCYNCHAIANYGMGAHIGEQFTEANCNGTVNTNSVNAIGADRLLSQNSMTYTDTKGVIYTIGTNSGNGKEFSNIFGIQCNNCHNSGISAGNIFGGIHGSADPTYQDGVNNTTKHERFLPGLGNVMFVPGTRGGIAGGHLAFSSYSTKASLIDPNTGIRFKGTYSYTTGGVTNDTNWEEKSRIPVGNGVTAWSHNPGAAGCYTITAGEDEAANAESNGVPAGPAASKGLTAPDGTLLFGTWGGCDDHSQQAGSSVRQPRSGNTSIRPVTY